MAARRTCAGPLEVPVRIVWPLVFTAWSGAAEARRPVAPTVPTVAEVVEGEGFTPTPSQSELYRPGVVLVPNALGGHDAVVDDCIDAVPTVAPMSQSSIAATLSAGVTTRLGVSTAALHAGVEKRLTFIDPEQRTIALGDLTPTASCREKLATAGRIRDLSDAIVVHDVLVAIVQNTVCTTAEASGRVVALGAAEASVFSECTQQSNAQIPLGFKGVPLDRVVAPVVATVHPTSVSPQAGPGCPWASITSAAASRNTLVLNGQSIDVRGSDAALYAASQLRACGKNEAALAFEDWRRRRKQVRVSSAVLLYGWFFIPRFSKKAELARRQMLEAL